MYKIISKIGEGGNGIVWKVSDEKSNLFAKKTIKNINNKKNYKRFRDEIYVIKNLKHKGIIEIIDSYIPKEINAKTIPYYIMPFGIPLKEYIENIDLDETLNIIFKIIDSIEFIHEKNITHRDIKIENLLIINNEPKLSDFGLANFPKQNRISTLNEKIGPLYTIAPEMKRISTTAEYKKADVYSLAKTIYVILSKNWLSFEGQYNNYSNFSLKNFIDLKINKMTDYERTYYHSIVTLEQLLKDSTHNDPDKRPNIKEFKEKFRFWVDNNNDYFLRNNLEWEHSIKRIFPISIPLNSEWINIEEIKNILEIIFTNYDNLNHCFFPISGGLDFEKIEIISISNQKYLLINNDYLLRPKKLIFEFMNDFLWSYFRLETEEQKRFFPDSIILKNEEIIYIDSNNNISPIKENNFKRMISHFLDGSFLIVQKTAKINNLSGKLDHYLGVHNTINNDDYKELLIKIINAYKKVNS